MSGIDAGLIAELEAFREPRELIAEIFRRFGPRAAIGTSGQLTGVVMIDMAAREKNPPRVFTIDTLRLFPETYRLFEALEAKYHLKIERMQPDPARLQAMLREHGEYLFFDSKAKQELCCHLRKVEPNERALDSLDVWLTGLRSEQSAQRAGTLRFQLIAHGAAKRPILKVAPLVDWSEARLRDYIREHDLPSHALLAPPENPGDWFYESLGCVICTTPIGPYEPRRAGRWRWFNDQEGDKECGLHVAKED